MTITWIDNTRNRHTPEAKERLFRYATIMAEAAIAKLKDELTPEELEEFWDYCDNELNSGAYGLRLNLANNLIPMALGLDV